MTLYLQPAIILGAAQAINTGATDLFGIIFIVWGLYFAIFAA